ncbi:MAG: DUF4157 domain-containing protein [Myxococcales bacterium]|nr:DUF4157 domain-containing protein [Myxococcales bacterium]
MRTRSHASAPDHADASPSFPRAPGKVTLTSRLQRKGGAAPATSPEAQHAAATAGMQGPRQSLPYAAEIERCFGFTYDLSGVGAFIGGPATDACAELGAQAYASGDAVAFASAPDLHTAAHEAAHVVQQRGGVQLRDGIGRAGDAYERHADAVADAVVAGRSAEALLAECGGGGGGARRAIQRKDGEPRAGAGRGAGNVPGDRDAVSGLAAVKLAYHAVKAVDAKLEASRVNRIIYDDALAYVLGKAGAVGQEWGLDQEAAHLMAPTLERAQMAPDDLFTARPSAPSAPAAPAGRLPADLPAPKPRINFEAEVAKGAPPPAAAKKPPLSPKALDRLSKGLKVADKTLAILGIIGGAKNIYDGVDKFSKAQTRGDHMEAMLQFDQGVLGFASGVSSLASLTRVAGVTGLAAALLQLRAAGAELLAKGDSWHGKDSLDLGFDTYDAASKEVGPVAGAIAGVAVTAFAACGEIVWGVAATLREVASLLEAGLRLIMADDLEKEVNEMLKQELRPEHWRDHTPVVPAPDVPRREAPPRGQPRPEDRAEEERARRAREAPQPRVR